MYSELVDERADRDSGGRDSDRDGTVTPAVLRRLVVALLAVGAVVVALWAGMPQSRADLSLPVALIVANLVAAGCAAWTAKRARGAERRWRALLVVSGLGPVAGAVSFVLDRYEPGQPPTGMSVTDVIFLVGPLFAVLALVNVPTSPVEHDTPSDAFAGSGALRPVVLVLDSLMITGSVVLVVWAALLNTVVRTLSTGVARFVVGLSYSVSGLVAAVVLIMIATFRRPHNPRALVVLGAGIFCTIGSEFVYVYLLAVGRISTNSWYSLGGVAGSLLAALAVAVPRAPDRPAGTRGPRQQRRVAWLHVYLPYLPTTAALVLVAVLAVRGGGVDAVDAVELSLAIGLVGLVVLRQLITLVQNTSLLTRVQQGRRDLQYQAFHDPLTGLANRALFAERLDRAVEAAGRPARPGQPGQPGRSLALLFCDLDDFKVVNDTLGHAAGDELLVAVARRLSGCVRDTDTVARLGGDEFAVLLVGDPMRDPTRDSARDSAPDQQTPDRVANRVADAMRSPFAFARRSRPVRVSIGMAQAESSGHRPDAEELLHRADAAMYAAKRQATGALVVYGPDLAAVPSPGELADPLAEALSSGGPLDDVLDVHYQPINSLPDGRVVAFEALVRWFRPGEEAVSATQLVLAAERSGLVGVLDDFVLDRACADLAVLRARFGPDVSVHVNVSAARVGDDQLVDTVVAALDRHGSPAHGLVVEVTETWEISDLDAAARVLGRLSAAGVRIALDDVGSGHSSIAALHRLPLDVVKLDRCLVVPVGVDDRAAVQVRAAMVGLARSLGIDVVAEGVETPAQVAAMVAAGCGFGQGYYLGRPAPVEDTWPAASVAGRRRSQDRTRLTKAVAPRARQQPRV